MLCFSRLRRVRFTGVARRACIAKPLLSVRRVHQVSSVFQDPREKSKHEERLKVIEMIKADKERQLAITNDAFTKLATKYDTLPRNTGIKFGLTSGAVALFFGYHFAPHCDYYTGEVVNYLSSTNYCVGMAAAIFGGVIGSLHGDDMANLKKHNSLGDLTTLRSERDNLIDQIKTYEQMRIDCQLSLAGGDNKDGGKKEQSTTALITA